MAWISHDKLSCKNWLGGHNTPPPLLVHNHHEWAGIPPPFSQALGGVALKNTHYLLYLRTPTPADVLDHPPDCGGGDGRLHSEVRDQCCSCSDCVAGKPELNNCIGIHALLTSTQISPAPPPCWYKHLWTSREWGSGSCGMQHSSHRSLESVNP